MESLSRVVALIDMDCFYCACERALQPELCGKPLVVVQYNPFQGDGTPGDTGVKTIAAEDASSRVVVRGSQVFMPSALNGSIIAVSYEARERGVTRFMRGKEASAQCPELTIVQVPTAHGKSDMGIYRSYGAKVRKLVSEVCGPASMMEKASVDEMYVDITAPARAMLSELGVAKCADDAAEAGTHVAGATEGASEAAMGQQRSGRLGRSAFRSGHAGQVERDIDEASRQWWGRDVADWPQDEALLAAGAATVARARACVTQKLGFTCSAGVAANKLLAKLCGGLHKPNQQTILPPVAVADLLDPLPVDRLRGFGAKLGELLQRGRPELGIDGFDSVGALRRAGVVQVTNLLKGEWPHPEEKANIAYRMACGQDDAAVEERPFSKQIGGGKNFSGARGRSRGPLDTYDALEVWVREFAEDVWSRLEEEEELNERMATQLVVHVRVEDGLAARSKRCTLRPGAAAITSDAMSMLRQLTSELPPHRLGIIGCGLTADNFASAASKTDRGALQRLFQKAAERATVTTKSQGSPLLIGAVPEPPAKQPRLIVVDDSPEDHAGQQDVASKPGAEHATPQTWSCGACTFLNRVGSRCCEICNTARTEGAKSMSGADCSAPRSTGRASVGSKRVRAGGIAAFLQSSSTGKRSLS